MASIKYTFKDLTTFSVGQPIKVRVGRTFTNPGGRGGTEDGKTPASHLRGIWELRMLTDTTVKLEACGGA